MTGVRSNPLLIIRADALRDQVGALPRELVCEVFRKLDFAGRLAVSHVCTSWRILALSDRHLWAQWRAASVSFSHSGIETMAAALTEMLARSSPLPFNLECHYVVPDPICELVIANVGRMEVLHLGQLPNDAALERILAQEVPVLRQFSFQQCMRMYMRIVLPARWAAAPCLETFSLACSCVFPSGCTIPTLRSFAGWMPVTQGADVPLLAMFPNVTRLSLSHVTNESLARLEPLPRLLTALELCAADRVDCAALLRGWKTTTLRELRIDWASSTVCVLEVFLLFLRTAYGPWALHLADRFASLRAPPSGPDTPTHHYYVQCITDFWHKRVAEVLPLCSRLCQLNLPLYDLLPLCTAHAVLSALTAVTVNLSQQDDNRCDALQDQPRVHAPALRNVVVDVTARKEFDARSAEMAVLIVRTFRSPRLAGVVIRVHPKQPFPGEDIAGLSDLAGRVEVRGPAENVLHAYTSAAEGTASSAA